MINEKWDTRTHPLWHGSAPMDWVVNAAGPSEMLVRGEGSWLFDRGGRRFLDARAGIANMMLGYSRADIAEAMYRQALQLPFVCTMRYERPAPVIVDCARALVDRTSRQLTRVRFTHTGSSAVEAALLMARRYHANRGRPGKRWIVTLRGSYHGSTLMTMAATGQPMLHELFGPMPDGFVQVAAPDQISCNACLGRGGGVECIAPVSAAVADIGEDRTAAIVVEPVMGLRGIRLPDHYLRSLRNLCQANDILLVFDEVFTGFGRAGPMFAHELSGVVPDILCLSKGVAAGYAPLGAVVVNDAVYDAFNIQGKPYFAHGSSTDAHPVACAAGLATLHAYDRDDILERGRRLGERLRVALADRLSGHEGLREVRGIGPFVFVEPSESEDRMARMQTMRQVQAECERRGVLIDYTPDVLMLAPPLTMTDDESDLAAGTVADVLETLEELVVDPEALRPPSASGRR